MTTHPNLEKTLRLCAAACLMISLSYCGAIDLINGEQGGPTTQSNAACGSDYSGPDTDGDGASDDCEALMGSDPTVPDTNGNGILDGSDFPGDPQFPEEVTSQPWWKEYANKILSDTSYSSVLTSSFLNEGQGLPFGSSVNVTDQKIYIIIDGEYGHAPGASAYSFCQQGLKEEDTGHEDFFYFYIKGDVQLCESCQQKNDIMELCGKLDDSLSLASFVENEENIIENFSWHIGRTLAGTFSPEVIMKSKDNPGTTTIKITPRDEETNGSSNLFNKVKVRFENSFTVQGQAKTSENSTGVEINTPNNVHVQRTFQRSGSGTAEENPSIVGKYVNQSGSGLNL